jgi:hypothetical protein
VARQKRISLDGEHFYVDLVFYNYLLKCFVLIDLKLGKLTHQDIDQMDTYGVAEWLYESGSPSLAGKGLGVRSDRRPGGIDLTLNPSPTGEGL